MAGVGVGCGDSATVVEDGVSLPLAEGPPEAFPRSIFDAVTFTSRPFLFCLQCILQPADYCTLKLTTEGTGPVLHVVPVLHVLSHELLNQHQDLP